MWQKAIAIIVIFGMGFVAGYFSGLAFNCSSPELPLFELAEEEKNKIDKEYKYKNAIKYHKNEKLIRVLENTHPNDWDPSYEEDMFMAEYAISYGRPDYVSIFKDGSIFTGKNLVYLHSLHIERVKKLYKKIEDYKRRREKPYRSEE